MLEPIYLAVKNEHGRYRLVNISKTYCQVKTQAAPHNIIKKAIIIHKMCIKIIHRHEIIKNDYLLEEYYYEGANKEDSFFSLCGSLFNLI